MPEMHDLWMDKHASWLSKPHLLLMPEMHDLWMDKEVLVGTASIMAIVT